METLKNALISICFVIGASCSLMSVVILLEMRKEYQSMVTVYTPKNIYYLTGRDISDENGNLGAGFEFTTKNHALSWLEEMTANDSRAIIYENQD